MKDLRITIIILALFALSLSSCDRTRNDKGYEYFPDMAHSLAYETYAPNPNTADGANLAPVEGTLARGETYFPYGSGTDGRILAGQELVNPIIEATPEVISEGKEQYDVFCLMCHGEKGDGNGPLFKSGLYTYQPRSLINEKMVNVPDGEIYHAITAGFGLMGAHGAQVSPEDRWKIIVYLRQELQN